MKFTAAIFSGLVAVASADHLNNFNQTSTAAAAAGMTTGVATVGCETAYNACRVAPNANRATCASQYASCLGYNPFASNGTNTVTAGAGNSVSANVAYVTEVVTSFTTYCPAPTVLTVNSKTYTVTKATTLTITDCPCTLTKPVAATFTPVAPVAPVNGTMKHNATGIYTTTVPAKTTTAILTAYTTYCPTPTTLTIGSSTYTVSKPTTIVYSATTPFPVTQTKSAFTSVVTPASGTNSVATKSSTPSTTVVPFTGGAAGLTVGAGALAMAAVALLL